MMLKMKKVVVVALSAMLLVCTSFLFACGGGVEITEFKVPETAYVGIGETYTITDYSAKGSDEKTYPATVTVKDPSGKTVEVANGAFKPTVVGNYSIIYTVSVDKKETSKTMTLEVFDDEKPQINFEYGKYNFVDLNKEIDLSSLSATDNSGQAVTVTKTVYLNDEELDNAGDTLVIEEEGTYTVKAESTDASGNIATEEYRFFSALDFENGVYAENEFYYSQISDLVAKNGEHSLEVGIFDNNISWFRDASFFGDINIATDCEYFVFWAYFDLESAGFEGIISIQESFFETTLYNADGSEAGKNHNNLYAMSGNDWYRFVVKMDGATSLKQFKIDLAIWDLIAGGNAAKISKVYVDDMTFTNDPTSTEPPVGEQFKLVNNSLYEIGSYFDMRNILPTKEGVSVKDYSVKFGNVVEVLSTKVLTMDKSGAYEITLTLSDDSEEKYVLFTQINFEAGYWIDNQYYDDAISSLHAKTGSKSYEFSAFKNHITWFGDESMLPNATIVGDNSVISFWIYFDMDAIELDAVVVVKPETYGFTRSFYNENGESITGDLHKNTWYEVRVDMGEQKSLGKFKILLELWKNGGGISTAHKIYIDDVSIFKA